MPALATVSRAIWATPAASWHDVVARAELVAFWRRPLRDETYHGYDDPFAEKKLVDAIGSVVRGAYTPLPAFEPPPLLLEYRHLDLKWEELWIEREPTCDEKLENFNMTFDIERALLNKPAVTWADIAIRAELTAHHRNDCEPTERVPVWIPGEEPDPKDDWRLCDHSAFAELLRAVMTLGNCVWPIDLSEVYWEQTNRELWERARAKSRVRHAEVVALRKAYARHGA